jgi:hypothetical protein
MKLYVALVLGVLAFSSSCKHNQKDQTGKQTREKNFFPVADYIQGEIQYVDSLPLGITKYFIRGNSTDTSYIQSTEFNQIAREFMCAKLEPHIFEKEFSETSFIDATSQAATFTYSTQNKQSELKRVDVLAGSGEGTNKVTSVYLQKEIRHNDTLILKKLLWRTRTSLQIVTSIQDGNKSPVVTQLKLVWGIE